MLPVARHTQQLRAALDTGGQRCACVEKVDVWGVSTGGCVAQEQCVAQGVVLVLVLDAVLVYTSAHAEAEVCGSLSIMNDAHPTSKHLLGHDSHAVHHDWTSLLVRVPSTCCPGQHTHECAFSASGSEVNGWQVVPTITHTACRCGTWQFEVERILLGPNSGSCRNPYTSCTAVSTLRTAVCICCVCVCTCAWCAALL